MAINTSNQNYYIQDLTTWDPLIAPTLSIFNISGPYSFTGNSGQAATVTYSFDSNLSIYDGSAFLDEDNIEAIPVDQRQDIRDALNSWSNVADISFVEDNIQPNILITEASQLDGLGPDILRFDINQDPNVDGVSVAGQNIPVSVSGAQINQVEVVFRDSFPFIGVDNDYAPGTFVSGSQYYPYATSIHEFGHALGLSHPKLNEGTADYNRTLTIMSSNNLIGWTNNDTLIATPMIYDIATVQFLYGANDTFADENTEYIYDPSYDFGQDANSYKTFSGDELARTIWDANGDDTINASNAIEDVIIDLRGGVDDGGTPSDLTDDVARFSRIGDELIAIAFGVTIENAIGGSGEDALYGNNADNVLEGGSGADIYHLSGSYGNDTIIDSDGLGSIVIDGQVLSGTADYFDGDQWILDGYRLTLIDNGLYITNTGVNNNTIFIEGFVDNSNPYLGITLEEDTVPPGAIETDLMLDGDDEANVLVGGSGNDSIKGFAGNDALIGGSGNDTLQGDQGNDVLVGGNGDDILVGNDDDDTVYGGAGNDTLTSEGSNLVFGGIGDDLFSGGEDTAVSTLNGGVGNDDFSDFRNDRLFGDAGSDFFELRHANDVDGGDSQDILFLSDLTSLDIGNGTYIASSGDIGTFSNIEAYFLDTGSVSFINAIGSANDDTIVYATGSDTINGNGGDDLLVGIIGSSGTTAGSRIINGGSGNDTISGSPSGLETVSLEGGIGNDLIYANALDLQVDFDIIREQLQLNIESGNFSNLAPTSNNIIDGGEGDDTIYASADGDTITGGSGADLYIFEPLSTTAGTHTITDFAINEIGEQIDLSFVGSNLTIDAEQLGADTQLSFNNQIILLQNVTATDLTIGDFIGVSTINIVISPTEGNDLLVGTAGDDTLEGLGGDDTLEGNAGNDILDGGGDNDFLLDTDSDFYNQLFGGSGNDTLEGSGELYGDDGDDLLLGYQFFDGASFGSVLDGGSGNDTLDASGITDDIVFGIGLQLLGGIGDDSIIGSFLQDTVSGDAGNDTLFGGDGNDELIGDGNAGDGDDEIYGGDGDDDIYGDEEFGGFSGGNDTIDGGSGNDEIRGGLGADSLLGGDGNDTIWNEGGFSFALDGINTMTGGAGSDRFNLAQEVFVGDSHNIITDFDVNEAGELIDLSFLGSNMDLVAEQIGSDTLLTIPTFDTNSTHTLLLQGVTATDLQVSHFQSVTNITVESSVNTITGSSGDDTLIGTDGDDSIDAGDGDDTLIGGSGLGDDTYDGGLGNDWIIFPSTSQGIVVDLAAGTASGTEIGSDTITNIENVAGGSGNDNITGDANDNILDGAAGDDILTGGAGNDTLIGNEGTNTLNFATGDGHDVVQDSGQDDTLVMNGTILSGDADYVSSGNWSLNVGGTDYTLAHDGDDLTINEVGNSNDSIILEGFDTVVGGFGLATLPRPNTAPIAQDDAFSAGQDVSITGNVLDDNGNGADSDPDGDTLTVVMDNITTAQGGTVSILPDGSFTYTPALGFTGTDSFDYTVEDGFGGSDTGTVSLEFVGGVFINDGNGDDSVVGGVGHDTLNGGNGNDTVDGNAGHDSLIGGNGNDLIYGDSGLDTINSGNGHDTLFGGDDDDILQTGNGNDSADGGSGNDMLDGHNGNDTLIAGTGDDTINAGNGNDSIDAGDGDDTITGFNGNDTIYAGDGNDTIEAGNGSDLVDAGAGNDVLDGFNGNDSFTGGEGADTMTGGWGADKFIYTSLTDSTDTAMDVITDFDKGNNTIDLTGLGFTGIISGAATGTELGYSYDSGTDQTTITTASSNFTIALEGDITLSSGDFVFA